mmetsp:Transcript_15818/g.40766  ORF Transcript_15818/g.40766 Transcript_15818/m.40766 type:complete len:470 (-) Transcript_15818:225-1634(-)
MEVGLGLLGEVEVDDDIHRRDVDAAREQVGRDEVAAEAIPKVMEDAVAVGLEHLCMDVKARVAKLGDLLGEQLDAVDRVAEDDRLVDLQLREERVEAVDLLALLDEGIVLRDALQCELLHEVDLIGLAHDLVLERLDLDGEGGGEEKHLPLLRHEVDQLLDERLELGGEELVRLVEAAHGAVAHRRDALLAHVEQAAGRGDDDVDSIVQAEDVLLERRATSAHHHLEAKVLAKVPTHLRRLQRELPRRHEDHRLDVGLGGVRLLEHGDDEGGGLSRAVLRAGQDVAPRERDWDRLLLDGRGTLKARLEDAHQQLTLEEVVLELVALGRGDVLRLGAHILRGERQTVLPFLGRHARRRRHPARRGEVAHSRVGHRRHSGHTGHRRHRHRCGCSLQHLGGGLLPSSPAAFPAALSSTSLATLAVLRWACSLLFLRLQLRCLLLLLLGLHGRVHGSLLLLLLLLLLLRWRPW